MEIMTQIRGLHYLYGVFRNRQADPFCRDCNGFRKTLDAAKALLDTLEREHAAELHGLPSEFASLFAEAKAGITALQGPENPRKQKKEGNCKLAEGVCFLKSSLALIQKA